MGSFNVTCAVSHLSIGQYDPAVLIPLKMNEDAFKHFGTQFGQAFQAYPAIRGVYDDYGCMADVDLEGGYYNYCSNGAAWLSLAIGDERDVIEGFTYAWVHGAVYNAMIAGLPSSEKISTNPLDTSTLSADMLRRLGLVEVGKTGLERYNRKFVDARCPEYFVASDGRFSVVYCNGEKLEQHIYSAQHLIEAWPVPLDTSTLAGQRLFDLLLDQQIDAYLSAMKFQATSEVFAEKLLDEANDGDTLQAALEFSYLLSASGNFALNQMEEHLGMRGVIGPVVDHLQDATVKKGLADLGQFLLACSLTGTLLTPSISGPQFGDHPASFALAELIYQLAKGNLAAYQDGDEDNDE